mmetsp:Transcript_36076/g.87669  ORF Transcript_36076/g.87669 Transcript_36076/m.87669 type:complete len:203 (+) Transcript_36076:473-1081(+)
MPGGGGGGGCRRRMMKMMKPSAKMAAITLSEMARTASPLSPSLRSLASSFCWHSSEVLESAVFAATGGVGSPKPPTLPVLTRKAVLVPAGSPSTVHEVRLVWQPCTALHVAPPSMEYSTLYASTSAADCSAPQYCPPSVATYAWLEPGWAHVSFIAALRESPVGTCSTRTFTGGSGLSVGAVSTWSFAFCARLEKLLLREDM